MKGLDGTASKGIPIQCRSQLFEWDRCEAPDRLGRAGSTVSSVRLGGALYDDKANMKVWSDFSLPRADFRMSSIPIA